MSIQSWDVVLMDGIHKAHGWHVDKEKVRKAIEANETCLLPIKRQRFIGEGKIVGYTYISEVSHWIIMRIVSC